MQVTHKKNTQLPICWTQNDRLSVHLFRWMFVPAFHWRKANFPDNHGPDFWYKNENHSFEDDTGFLNRKWWITLQQLNDTTRSAGTWLKSKQAKRTWKAWNWTIWMENSRNQFIFYLEEKSRTFFKDWTAFRAQPTKLIKCLRLCNLSLFAK